MRTAVWAIALVGGLCLLTSAREGRGATTPALMLQTGHTTDIFSFALSPDGNTLATAGDSSVRLWDVPSGRLIRVLSGHDDFAASVAFSPDGKQLVSGQRFGKVRLWNLATGAVLHTWKHESEHDRPTDLTVLFAGAGSALRVISGGDSEEVMVWNPATGKCERTVALGMKAGSGHSIAVDPSVRSLAVVRDLPHETNGVFFDLTTGKKIRTFGGHSAVAFSHNGKKLFFASKGSDIQWKSLAEWGTSHTLAGTGTSRVTALALSQDGRLIAARDAKGNIRVQEVDSSKTIRTWPAIAPDNAPLLCTPDAKQVLDRKSLHRDGVRFRSVATGELVRIVGEGANVPVASVAFSPNGELMQLTHLPQWHPGLTDNAPSTSRLWSLTRGRPLRSFPHRTIAVSPDGRLLAWAAVIEPALLEVSWSNLTSGEKRARFLSELASTDTRTAQLRFSPDGKWLAVAPADTPALTLFDVSRGQRLGNLAPEDAHFDFAFSPDHKSLIVFGEKSITVWDPATLKQRDTPVLKGLASWRPIPGGGLSPDGRLFVAVNTAGKPTRAGGPIVVCDLSTGKVVLTTDEHEATAGGVAFHPDSKSLWVSGGNGIARWNLATAKKTLAQPVGFVAGHALRLAVHPNGKYLAVRQADGTVTFRAIEDSGLRQVCTLALLRDGQWVVTGPDGSYDASRLTGIEGLHALVDGKPVDVTEAKGVRRVPGLLARALGK